MPSGAGGQKAIRNPQGQGAGWGSASCAGSGPFLSGVSMGSWDSAWEVVMHTTRTVQGRVCSGPGIPYVYSLQRWGFRVEPGPQNVFRTPGPICILPVATGSHTCTSCGYGGSEWSPALRVCSGPGVPHACSLHLQGLRACCPHACRGRCGRNAAISAGQHC